MAANEMFLPDTGSKFMRFSLTEEQQKIAYQVSPMFLAMLQNKIEAYATALVEKQLPYESDPKAQTAAILEHERLRNFVHAYEELLQEILQSSSQPESN